MNMLVEVDRSRRIHIIQCLNDIEFIMNVP